MDSFGLRAVMLLILSIVWKRSSGILPDSRRPDKRERIGQTVLCLGQIDRSQFTPLHNTPFSPWEKATMRAQNNEGCEWLPSPQPSPGRQGNSGTPGRVQMFSFGSDSLGSRGVKIYLKQIARYVEEVVYAH